MAKKYSDVNGIALPKRTGRLIILMAQPYKWRTVLFFALSGLGIFAWTASPVVVSTIVTDLGKSPKLDSTIWWLVAGYFVLRILDEGLWRLAEVVMRTFKPQMIERVRSILFNATLHKPHAYFINSSSGRIGYWINQTTATINELVDTTIWTVWGRMVGLVVSAIFLFFVHWSIAVLFIVWLVALFWYTSHRGVEFSRRVADQSDETSKASGVVVDSLSNHLSVRIFNARRHERGMLTSQQDQIIDKWRHSWIQNLLTNIVKGQSAAFVSALALAIVILLFAHGVVPLGGVVLFIAYFGDASSSLWELAWALDSYYRTFGTVQNALDGLNGEDERTGPLVKRSNLPKTVSLQLDDVSFAYPDQPKKTILHRISLDVAAGQKVGVVGHSGAGKSTLAGLLLGFYEPTKGNIKLNETLIADKDPSFMRSLVAFVPQDTNLFNRTVRENIVYARPDATEAELQAALRQAEAKDFIDDLPKGLDTLVGERGVKLSGGQRQRIAIARAILKDAPLLLLDEATSALDSVSEQAIQRSLHNLMKDRTSIVIAHRLSTLRHLDKIVVFSGGEIVEEGPHDRLIERDGIYADLWRRQKDGFIIDD